MNYNPALYSYSSGAPDIREIFQALLRQHRIILAVGAVVTIFGLLVVMAKPTFYNASATVIINDNQLKLDDFTDVTESPKFSDFTVQTEVRILTSSSLAMETIKVARLENAPEFSAAEGDTRELLSMFADRLSVNPQGSSRVIEVSFRAEDPDLAAHVANAHVQTYLANQIERKNKQVVELKNWFERKVEELKGDVVKKSGAVSSYRAQSNLPADALLDVVQAPHIRELKIQESQIANKLEGLESKYGYNHPEVREAKNQLDQVQKAIEFEVDNVVGSVQGSMEVSIPEIGVMQTESQDATPSNRPPVPLGTPKDKTVNLDDAEFAPVDESMLSDQGHDIQIQIVALKNLMAEQAASQNLLDSFMSNYERLQSQDSFARPDAVIASEAIIPIFPMKPGKKLLMIFVVVFAGIVALGSALLMELLRGGIQNFDDIRKLNQTPLGILPDVTNPVQLMLSPMNSNIKEAAKQIYMTGLMNTSTQTILVTSAMPDEGRTTFVKLFGYYLISMGHKVLVIDADFLKPELSNMAPDMKSAGFSDILAGRVSLATAIQKDSHGLSILKAGSLTDSLPDLLRAENLQMVLNELKKEYTHILIDSGPALARNEAGAIAQQVDGVIIVTQWSKTLDRNIKNMMDILKSKQAKIVGVVLSRVDIGKYKGVSIGSDFLLPRIVSKVA